MGANVSIVADGDLSTVTTVKTVEEIGKIKEIGRLSAFPEYRQPYNKMLKKTIPATKKSTTYTIDYNTPDYECEILGLTFSCTGYAEGDYINVKCNDRLWFDTWYLSELKEGLYLGTSTFAYKTPANSRIEIEFHNESGTYKTFWVGVRMLVPDNIE